ncbi:class I SAM-dependent RNA methyltransferase [Malonomonas rubra]|uniref:THUMP domain-containing class I SAM-dependent RNA methyltransferase n=1 Tax=Malonomonas rubra TaxID=57040 RepID=UPI0026F2B37B|nr:class I SAM-dependent RNA methyltransferase [Malonomonas rubra]
MSKQFNSFFAVTPPGFEPVCAHELDRLGLTDVHLLAGGVEFSGGLQELYLANLWLRSAGRVLVRVGNVQARDFPTLYKRLLRLPWGSFIKPGTDPVIRATCHRSRLSHSGRVAETCQQAIRKALGAAESSSMQAAIYLRLEDDRCQVSIDSTGDLLHRRGYRQANVAAPLRENLAAGCLLTLGYDGSVPLIDAMTGSGTFAIEAALIARNLAPGAARKFAFMGWPKYRSGLWNQLLLEAQQAERPALESILAIDSNPKAIIAAQKNMEAAHLFDDIALHCQRIQELSPPQVSGLIICNPPYGERLGRTAALQALYKDLGRIYGETFSSWRGAMVCPDSALARSTGVPFTATIRFSNGGIRVALLEKQQK